MTKTPTAEEVLAKYREFGDKAFMQFHEAFEQWQASQGPVTREWFIERFGAEDVKCERGQIGYWDYPGIVEIAIPDSCGDLAYADLQNPTRERIEALVEMLGGTDAS